MANDKIGIGIVPLFDEDKEAAETLTALLTESMAGYSPEGLAQMHLETGAKKIYGEGFLAGFRAALGAKKEG